MLSMKSTSHILKKLSFHFSLPNIRLMKAGAFIIIHCNISSAMEQCLALNKCLSNKGTI